MRLADVRSTPCELGPFAADGVGSGERAEGDDPSTDDEDDAELKLPGGDAIMHSRGIDVRILQLEPR